jgi:hypothetical protein
MSLECNVCEGKGGYTTDLEGSEVETCNTCSGSGELECCECGEEADLFYAIDGIKESVCQRHFDRWTGIDAEDAAVATNAT